MPTPRVSVVMAAYNHAQFVQRAIDSVLSQTFSDFEFLAADDGSIDGTFDVMSRTTDPRVQFWSAGLNRGACVTMNEVISRSVGEYIAVINSDDEFVSNKLALQVAFMDAHPEIGAVFGRVRFIDEQGGSLPSSPAWNENLFPALKLDGPGLIKRIITQGNCLCHPTLLIRRTCYERVGLYDPRLASLPDQDMWLRLLLANISISVMDETLLLFRVLNGERNASASSEANLTRHIVESNVILDQFSLDGNKSQLVIIFPEFINEFEPLVSFANLMSNSSIPGQRLWGIRKRFELLPAPSLLGHSSNALQDSAGNGGLFASLNRDAGRWLGCVSEFYSIQVFWAYGTDSFAIEQSVLSRQNAGNLDVRMNVVCRSGLGAIRLRIDPSEQVMRMVLRSIVLSRAGMVVNVELDHRVQVSGTARLLNAKNGVVDVVSIGVDPQIIIPPIELPGEGDICVMVHWTVESLDNLLNCVLPKDPGLLEDVLIGTTDISKRQINAEREVDVLRRRVLRGDVRWFDIIWGLMRLVRLSASRPWRWPGLLKDYFTILMAKKFDRIDYLFRYDDVSVSGEDPLAHYLVIGVKEGRRPDQVFEVDDYLSMVESDIGVDRDPYAHWIRGGCPDFLINSDCSLVVSGKARGQGVSIVIPTLDGGDLFRRSLEMIRAQVYEGPIQLVVVDSASQDGTDILAEKFGAEVCRIERKDFHHARTRQMAFGLTRYPNLVYFVQDAIPFDVQWLNRLVDALHSADDVMAVYGRQLPHEDADLFARFETISHAEYLGAKRRVQKASMSGIERNVARALFRRRFDNVCGGYRREALVKCPFPDVPFAEDLAWASQAIEQGWSIAFEPEVKVFHSHNRPPAYRMRRAFVDTVCCARILNKLSLKSGPAYHDVRDFEKLAILAQSLEASILKEFDNFCGPLARHGFDLKRSMLQLPEISDGWGRFLVSHATQVIVNICVKFPNEHRVQYESCVAQAVYSAHGLACGSILAMHEIHGGAPEHISKYLAPLFKGV